MCICAWFKSAQPAFGLTWHNSVLEPGLSGDMQVIGWAWLCESRGFVYHSVILQLSGAHRDPQCSAVSVGKG